MKHDRLNNDLICIYTVYVDKLIVMFREEILSSSSLWLDSVHVGAELNPKVEQGLYSEISE
jgi:hypothetical protein